MIKKKIKLYYKNLVQLFFKFLYGNVLVPKNVPNLIKKEKIKNKKYKSFRNKYYNIYKVENARIYTDNNENVAIIKDNLILPHISFQQINGKLKESRFNSVIKTGTPSFLKKIKGKVFNLSQGGSGNNYFHFIFDIIPKIYLLINKKKLNEIDYYYLTNPKRWQIEILKILGIKDDKILDSKIYNHIHAEEIYAVDHPWYEKGYIQYNLNKLPKWIMHENRKTFLKSITKNRNKRIFLDRSNSSFNHCQIENLDEITKLALRKKIKTYKPEQLSFKNQIKLFNNSSLVIGAHGAAFTNIIFCRPNTKIIEIIPSDHPNQKCKRISKVLNLNYYRIKTTPNNSDINFPFKIKLNKKNLNQIEKIISL